MKLHDGTKAYLHAVLDNFSRRIRAWKVVALLAQLAKTETPPNWLPSTIAESWRASSANAELAGRWWKQVVGA